VTTVDTTPDLTAFAADEVVTHAFVRVVEVPTPGSAGGTTCGDRTTWPTSSRLNAARTPGSFESSCCGRATVGPYCRATIRGIVVRPGDAATSGITAAWAFDRAAIDVEVVVEVVVHPAIRWQS